MEKQELNDSHYEATQEMLALAGNCILNNLQQRPKLIWLKARYEEKRKEYHLNKSGMDARIFTGMYGRAPEDPEELLKVRYWRTGLHMPLNRTTLLLFCRALEMDAADTNYMLTAYMDASLDFYEQVPPDTDKVYWTRRKRLEELVNDFLRRHGQGETIESRSRLRHL